MIGRVAALVTLPATLPPCDPVTLVAALDIKVAGGADGECQQQHQHDEGQDEIDQCHFGEVCLHHDRAHAPDTEDDAADAKYQLVQRAQTQGKDGGCGNEDDQQHRHDPQVERSLPLQLIDEQKVYRVGLRVTEAGSMGTGGIMFRRTTWSSRVRETRSCARSGVLTTSSLPLGKVTETTHPRSSV